jgi:zinc transport system substrate-binding protein
VFSLRLALSLATALSLALPLVVAPAWGDGLRIATDIATIQSLVMQVAGANASVDRFVSDGTSPHGHRLRPSEASNLTEADLVIYTGAVLYPGVPDILAALAPDAVIVDLSAHPETELLGQRGHEDFEGHAADDHDHDQEHGHESTGHDPHTWLDPDNARRWLGAIAVALANADPGNAAQYAANAAAARDGLDRAVTDASARLAPFRGATIVTTHDAFQYLEARWGLENAGTLSLASGAHPGPRQLAALRDRLATTGVRCILEDSREPSALLGPVAQNADVAHASIDPTGADLPPGPDLYSALITRISEVLEPCLGS